MPVVAFSNEVLADCKLLTTMPPDTLGDFCQLAIENVRRGAPANSKKIYASAAAALKVSPEAVAACVRSLSRVLMESAKHDLSGSDLTVSIAELKMPAPQSTKLAECYTAARSEIRSVLGDLSLQLAHYHDLDWRLDVQLASRCLRAVAKPTFLLQLHTTIPAAEDAKSEALAAAAAAATTAADSKTAAAADPLTAPVVPGTVKHTQYLQCDYANIKHLCSELEKAIAAAKSTHTRRIIKYVK